MDYQNMTEQQLLDRIALLEWFKRQGVMDRKALMELYSIKEILARPLTVSWGGKTYRRALSLCTVNGGKAP